MDPELRKRLRDDSVAGLASLGVDMSEFKDNAVAQQHAISFQLLAVKLGASYGVLSFGGLIVAHVALTHSVLGVVLALVGSLFAYANFSVIAADAESPWVGRTQFLSIGAGLLSGILLLAHAFS